jgi:hypothetical protein
VSRPAVLIIIDGESVYEPVQGTRYAREYSCIAVIRFFSRHVLPGWRELVDVGNVSLRALKRDCESAARH